MEQRSTGGPEPPLRGVETMIARGDEQGDGNDAQGKRARASEAEAGMRYVPAAVIAGSVRGAEAGVRPKARGRSARWSSAKALPFCARSRQIRVQRGRSARLSLDGSRHPTLAASFTKRSFRHPTPYAIVERHIRARLPEWPAAVIKSVC